MKQILCLTLSLGCLPLAAIEGPEDAQPANPKAVEGQRQPGYLGVYTGEIPDLLKAQMPDLKNGVVVRGVVGESPAKTSGVEVNDIITKIDGKPIGSPDQLREVLSGFNPKDKVGFEVLRGGKVVEMNAELSERPLQRGFAELNGVWEDMPGGAGGMEQHLFNQLGDLIPDQDLKELRKQLRMELRGIEGMNGGLLLKGNDMLELRKFNGERRDAIAEQFRLHLNGNGANRKVQSSVTKTDEQGKVTLKGDGKSKSLLMYDNNGNLLYEGPFNEDADLDAIPDDQLKRIEEMNLEPGKDLGFGALNFEGNLRR